MIDSQSAGRTSQTKSKMTSRESKMNDIRSHCKEVTRSIEASVEGVEYYSTRAPTGVFDEALLFTSEDLNRIGIPRDMTPITLPDNVYHAHMREVNSMKEKHRHKWRGGMKYKDQDLRLTFDPKLDRLRTKQYIVVSMTEYDEFATCATVRVPTTCVGLSKLVDARLSKVAGGSSSPLADELRKAAREEDLSIHTGKHYRNHLVRMPAPGTRGKM